MEAKVGDRLVTIDEFAIKLTGGVDLLESQAPEPGDVITFTAGAARLTGWNLVEIIDEGEPSGRYKAVITAKVTSLKFKIKEPDPTLFGKNAPEDGQSNIEQIPDK